MTDWTSDELQRVGRAEELEITTARPDGSVRPWVPIWVVRVGDELLVRSFRGPDGAWYRHATRRPEGRIRADGVERAVTFTPASVPTDEVDRAYRAKYGRYAGSYLEPMLEEPATATTLQIIPHG